MKKWEERSRRNVPKLVFSAPAEGGNITHDGYQKIGGYFGTVYIYGVISISAYTVFFPMGAWLFWMFYDGSSSFLPPLRNTQPQNDVWRWYSHRPRNAGLILDFWQSISSISILSVCIQMIQKIKLRHLRFIEWMVLSAWEEHWLQKRCWSVAGRYSTRYISASKCVNQSFISVYISRSALCVEN